MRPYLLSLFVLLSTFVVGQVDSIVVEDADTLESLPNIGVKVNGQGYVAYPYNSKGYFLYQNQRWDSLTVLLDERAEDQIWLQDSWNWTQRENSAIGGLSYNSLEPFEQSGLDGWHRFSRSYLQMPGGFRSSSPRSDLRLLTGIGGGQVFGITALAPVDSAKQLYVDYLRNNTLGLYRNEGTDGHELQFSLRQLDSYNISTESKLEVSYFNSRSGQNGGLSNPTLFESNVPTLRRNYAISDAVGTLFEEDLNVKYWTKRDLSNSQDLLASISFNSRSWAVNNSNSASEYFWDSTGTAPILEQRTLRYSDSLRLTRAQVELDYVRFYPWNRIGQALVVQTVLYTGLEHLQSNSLGWDGFRSDSVHYTEAFSTEVTPFLRGHVMLSTTSRSLNQYRAILKYNALGYNAGALDAMMRAKLRVGSGNLELQWNILHQPHMYRFEQLYGYSYDLRTVDVPYFKNEGKAHWVSGSKWKKEGVLYGAQMSGMRYFESFDQLSTWDGMYGRVQFGVSSNDEGWNACVQGYGAYKSSFGGFATPNWGGFTEVNYKTSIGTKFEWKAGITISVEDAFYAPTYLVGVPIWAMQTDYLAGSYPWATTYFEARIANFVGAVRIINALEGLAPYTYYAYGSTPRSDRWVQVSARWTLFN
jgi:lysozyme family protein